MSHFRGLPEYGQGNQVKEQLVKQLQSFNITPVGYAGYLWNLHPIYEMLEGICRNFDIFDEAPELRRAGRIYEDFRELWPYQDRTPPVFPAVNRYLDRLIEIQDDYNLLLAHVYIQHVSGLHTSQDIAALVPGSKRFYEYPDNIAELDERVHSKITRPAFDEARLSFEMSAQLFQEVLAYYYS